MAQLTPRSSPVITEPFEVEGSKRVMVVDADPSSRSILEVSLKRAGFNVAVQTSGREALQVLQSQGQRLPEVLVLSTDVHGTDGYSLIAQLRADARTAKLPLLLLARPDADERST